MKSKYEELPKQCRSCANLQCGYVRMDGHNEYRCKKIICFEKYKEAICKKYSKSSESVAQYN